jgi:uncharacterized membrane protein HdeD (DUF308 family)
MSDLADKGRTTWDLVLGGLLVVVGIVVLAHAATATVVSVLFIGWMAFAAGTVAVFVSLFNVGRDGFWTGLLGGGLIAVLGLVMIRNTGAAALTLTLVAGAMFLSTGVVRLAAAFQVEEARVPLVLAGGVSTLLGLLILFNLFTASLTLLGVLLGVQLLAEGVAIMAVGRHTMLARGFGDEPAPAA